MKINNFEDAQKELNRINQAKADRKLKNFEGLNPRLSEQVGEGEPFTIKDGTSYYTAIVIDGKLFRTSALTEVT